MDTIYHGTTIVFSYKNRLIHESCVKHDAIMQSVQKKNNQISNENKYFEYNRYV